MVPDLALGMGLALPKTYHQLYDTLEHEFGIIVGVQTRRITEEQGIRKTSWYQMRQLLEKHLLRAPNGNSSSSSAHLALP